MPLNTRKFTSSIKELVQPNRFTHLFTCECGWSSHVFSEAEAVAVRGYHLMARHGHTHEESPEMATPLKVGEDGGPTPEQTAKTRNGGTGPILTAQQAPANAPNVPAALTPTPVKPT